MFSTEYCRDAVSFSFAFMRHSNTHCWLRLQSVTWCAGTWPRAHGYLQRRAMWRVRPVFELVGLKSRAW